jgi:hypothetical protein
VNTEEDSRVLGLLSRLSSLLYSDGSRVVDAPEFSDGTGFADEEGCADGTNTEASGLSGLRLRVGRAMFSSLAGGLILLINKRKNRAM